MFALCSASYALVSGRARGWALALALLLLAPNAGRAQKATVDPHGTLQAAPITKGQRIFTCGHSFHAFFITPILQDMAQKAGIEGQQIVGVSKIGGSRVIQHWDIPDEKNEAKKALRAGRVDVLTLSPMHQPDEGIDKFAELAIAHNPDIRITIQEFWIPWDKFEWPFKGKPEAVDFDAATVAGLQKMHDPYFKTFDDYVVALNKKLGKQVLFVVPMGQAVLKLRAKIIAGEMPGVAKQSELFTDKLGHPGPVMQALEGYCHLAVIYRRSPIGLPMPDILANAKNPKWDDKLNRALQEIAWDAVVHHPLSGLTVPASAAAGAAPGPNSK
ncbi:MAG TPA: hypothetical protein VFE24_09810 [Pirellulales bacterium]|jgi:hypothetical protein|nr:hypothetical protein [Pirellulales bacterium]